MKFFGKTSPRVLLATALALLAVFLLDCRLLQGTAGGVLYAGIVLFSLWSPQRAFTGAVTVLCVTLAILGLMYTSPDGPDSVAILNRSFSVLAIVITGIVAVKRQAADERRAETEAKLSSIITYAGYGILSFDANGVVDSVNPAAATMFGYAPGEMTNRSIEGLIDPSYRADYKDYLISYLDNDQRNIVQQDIEVLGLRKNGSTFPMEINVNEVPSGRGILFIALVRDVTERSRVEQERVKLIGELKEALAQVKTLRGLIPICASCKKIRDDQGYWEQIEVYIHNHSDAEFSHGFCPECLGRLYPDLFPSGVPDEEEGPRKRQAS
ncbi:MAG: PAS domain S-box protein [Candidatus Hydrogenedentes bacterium]|nr:PAS domain S-box protein [Candidatus Hydrogenedentota bacterium]